ncbi:MAG: hypothetical protein R3D03_14065 [Geminicoccaceae bacterium]
MSPRRRRPRDILSTRCRSLKAPIWTKLFEGRQAVEDDVPRCWHVVGPGQLWKVVEITSQQRARLRLSTAGGGFEAAV